MTAVSELLGSGPAAVMNMLCLGSCLVVMVQLGFMARALELPRGNGARVALRLIVWPTLLLVITLTVITALGVRRAEASDLTALPLLIMMASLERLRRWMHAGPR